MVSQRDIRRLAMQVLYQIDLRGEGDLEAIRLGLVDGFDNSDVQASGFALATAAWAARETADRAVEELSPQWPTHRQPPVDRAILRLAHYEMNAGRTPVKVAINEAIELAKEYGAENSSSFVNGVLDKIAKPLLQGAETGQGE